LVRAGGDSEHHVEHINNSLVLRLRGKLLPLVSLSEVLKIDKPETAEEISFIAVCKVGAYSFGLIVDRVFDTEEIVVKPTSEVLKDISVYSGNTILGDGNVIMILDPNGLAKSTGEREIGGGREAVEQVKSNKDARNINFLLFRSGTSSPKAVPLELVSRLEEIDMTTVEFSGEHPVVQYRGELMRLRNISGSEDLPKDGNKEVIVFTYDNKTLGLVVDEIVDIVNATYDIKLSSDQKGFLGSMVIEGRTTDIVDVASLLREIVGQGEAEDLPVGEAKNAKLLLVEDSPFFRSLTVQFLNSAGYKVVSAGSAKEALSILAEKPGFDVIVSDIEMPEMDGFAFAEICQNSPTLSSIPIFAFSSARTESNLLKSSQVGFKDFILKTDRAALLHAIAEALHINHREKI
ncbi:MAG: chemotaxis protein CheW, partial [Pseudomonadota bacterium]